MRPELIALLRGRLARRRELTLGLRPRTLPALERLGQRGGLGLRALALGALGVERLGGLAPRGVELADGLGQRLGLLARLSELRRSLLARLRDRGVSLLLRAPDRRAGLLAREHRGRFGVLPSDHHRCLGFLACEHRGGLRLLARRRGRCCILARLKDDRLDLRHPHVGLARHRQQGALDLARPAPGPLELLGQLGGAGGQLALGALAVRTLLLEALRPVPAGLLDESGGLIASLRNLVAGPGARLCRGLLDLGDLRLGRFLRLRCGLFGLGRSPLQLAGPRPGRVDRPRRLSEALLQLLLARGVARVLRAQLGELGLQGAGPGDLARPRGRLVVDPARQQRRLLALAVALGPHAADLASDPRRRLVRRALLARAQVLDLLLGAGDLAPQLGDLALGAQELLLVAVAHAALLLDAALQLLEELRADHVEAVLLGQGLTQPLTQLRFAVRGS